MKHDPYKTNGSRTNNIILYGNRSKQHNTEYKTGRHIKQRNDTSGAGTAYLSGVPEFTSVF
jgi:hypothetical protein